MAVAKQQAAIVATIAAANGVDLDQSKLLAAWGFHEPAPPLTQQQSDDAMRQAWG